MAMEGLPHFFAGIFQGKAAARQAQQEREDRIAGHRSQDLVNYAQLGGKFDIDPRSGLPRLTGMGANPYTVRAEQAPLIAALRLQQREKHASFKQNLDEKKLALSENRFNKQMAEEIHKVYLEEMDPKQDDLASGDPASIEELRIRRNEAKDLWYRARGHFGAMLPKPGTAPNASPLGGGTKVASPVDTAANRLRQKLGKPLK